MLVVHFILGPPGRKEGERGGKKKKERKRRRKEMKEPQRNELPPKLLACFMEGVARCQDDWFGRQPEFNWWVKELWSADVWCDDQSVTNDCNDVGAALYCFLTTLHCTTMYLDDDWQVEIGAAYENFQLGRLRIANGMMTGTSFLLFNTTTSDLNQVWTRDGGDKTFDDRDQAVINRLWVSQKPPILH